MTRGWVIVCFIIAILVTVSASAEPIPTNPAKGSQYGNSLGSAVLVFTTELLEFSLGFGGVLGHDTVVLIERVTRGKTLEPMSEQTYYVPLMGVSGVDFKELFGEHLQDIPSDGLRGYSFVEYHGYGLLLRVTSAGTYVYVDVLESR